MLGWLFSSLGTERVASDLGASPHLHPVPSLAFQAPGGSTPAAKEQLARTRPGQVGGRGAASGRGDPSR
ncbi:Adhesion G-Protein Coupled Receptor V1 [Manis pentadactyla]|nr:Adhesion G-Protein Coupled Receptor V1 [Manis pentadactyla]